jgi:hypothetical protein
MECILCFEAWLDQPAYWEIGDATGDDERAEAAIASMMRLVVKFLPQQKGSGKQRGNGCWKVLKFIAQIHDAGLADQTAAFPRLSIVVLVPEHRSHRQILSLAPSNIHLCRGLSTQTESQPSVLKLCQHCPLFKLNGRKSTPHQRSQIGKLLLIYKVRSDADSKQTQKDLQLRWPPTQTKLQSPS